MSPLRPVSTVHPMSSADTRRFLAAGDRAVLVELPDLDATLGMLARLRERQHGDHPIPGVVELLPAARTLLVSFLPWRISHAALVRELRAISAEPAAHGSGELVEIPVTYDGEDLDEVAGHLGIDRAELIRRHTGSQYTVAFSGFAPGFAYLSGGHPSLDVPRRSTPRTRIPAGSVGLAGRFSGVYPRESPGGWQLIGTTATPMWDVDRDPPALLRPGARVRFVEAPGQRVTVPSTIEAAGAEATASATAAREAAALEGPALLVIEPGIRTLLQDAGRPGLASLGVSGSGALDLPALRRANRLVGNDPHEAGLEIPYGSARFRACGASVVALTGALAPVSVERARGGTQPVGHEQAVGLDDGDVLVVGAPTAGVRVVLAVRGGFAVATVLGSRSHDTLAGLGPAPLTAGAVLGIRAVHPPAVAVAAPTPPPPLPGDDVSVPIDLGPRDDWFSPAAIDTLLTQSWAVTPQADRVGLRLAGEQPLTRVVAGELASEGAPSGSIQVPPSGQPMLFLADHPVTGGYPIIGVVRHDALAALGQVPPGARLRFLLAHEHGPSPRTRPTTNQQEKP